MNALSCPGRGAAFFMPLRRTGTVPNTGVRDGPGSAAHRHSASKTRVNALMAKGGALRCVRGTNLGQVNFLTANRRCIAFLHSC
jgi:hypothetical protein